LRKIAVRLTQAVAPQCEPGCPIKDVTLEVFFVGTIRIANRRTTAANQKEHRPANQDGQVFTLPSEGGS